MAVNRGFVQLISLTVYCWLETFASCEEDLSMPAKFFSALPYIYIHVESRAWVSVLMLSLFSFPMLLKPLWGLWVCPLPSFSKLCYCLTKEECFLFLLLSSSQSHTWKKQVSSRHWKKVSNLVDAHCLPSIDSISSLHQKWQKTSTPHQGSCSLLFYIMCFC